MRSPEEDGKMIVEVFFKGSNFKRLYDTFWNIKSIVHDGNFIILATENLNDDAVLLNDNEYELRVTY